MDTERGLSNDPRTFKFEHHIMFRDSEFLNSGLASFLGSGLAKETDAATSDYFSDLDILRSSIRGITQRHQAAIQHVNNIVSAFNSLGLTAFTNPVEDVHIIIGFPERFAGLDAEEFGKCLSDVIRTLKLLSDIVGGTREDFPLVALSGSRFRVFVSSGVAVAAAFAARVSFSLESVSNYLDIRLKMFELRKLEIGIQADGLEELASSIADRAAEVCADRLLEEFSPKGDPGDARRKAMELSRQIIDRIEEGFQFDFRGEVLSTEFDIKVTNNGTELDAQKLAEFRRRAVIIPQLAASIPDMRERQLLEAPVAVE